MRRQFTTRQTDALTAHKEEIDYLADRLRALEGATPHRCREVLRQGMYSWHCVAQNRPWHKGGRAFTTPWLARCTAVAELRTRLGIPKSDETWVTVAKWPMTKEDEVAAALLQVKHFEELAAAAEQFRSSASNSSSQHAPASQLVEGLAVLGSILTACGELHDFQSTLVQWDRHQWQERLQQHANFIFYVATYALFCRLQALPASPK